MSLKEKINNNYQNSLKTKDKAEISTYRLILSAIKDIDIAIGLYQTRRRQMTQILKS